jgi:hypothetical protein
MTSSFGVLAQALAAIERLSPERFELDDNALESLRGWALGTAQLLQEQVQNLAREHQRHLNQPPSQKRDLGLGF